MANPAPPIPSITDKFRDDTEFVTLLTTLGLGVPELARLKTDGFDNMEILCLQYKLDTKSFKDYLLNTNKTFGSARVAIQVYFTPVIITRLTGMVHFFDQHLFTYHAIPDIALVTKEKCTEYGHAFETMNKRKTESPDRMKEIQIPKFKGGHSWMDFYEKLEHKLSLAIGARGFPLSYLLDTTERDITNVRTKRIEVDDLDIADDDIFLSCAVHFGADFKTDSATLWDLLKDHLLNTPAFNHISTFSRGKNGRQAYMTLLAYYEGEDFKERSVERAFSTMDSCAYRGEKARFSWEKYVNIHLTAHKDLAKSNYNAGAGLDEATKIQHLKRGIKPEAGLEHALTTARGQAALQASFQRLVNFLTAEVDNKNI